MQLCRPHNYITISTCERAWSLYNFFGGGGGVDGGGGGGGGGEGVGGGGGGCGGGGGGLSRYYHRNTTFGTGKTSQIINKLFMIEHVKSTSI